MDSISNFFTHIRNASLVRRDTVSVPNNQTNRSLAKILVRHGFIGIQQVSASCLVLTLKYKSNQPLITQIQRLSRPGCRLYVRHHNIFKICGNLGVAFLSTSQGILSDREAYSRKIGGEIIGFVS
uniref:Ribosomal protein S8 n=1 Tax=Tydemania expeditionis TaxID=325645 RepID=A0A0D6E1L8_TYDEX|nr:ribosomal protein S8 [Tydemania expeditionis]CEO91126.1 ribosomal protein S8 [Tydemania expeditionis]